MYMFLVSDLCWTKFLNVCDELPNGCSSRNDQILNTCDSIPKMCNAYILHFSKVFFMISECCVGI